MKCSGCESSLRGSAHWGRRAALRRLALAGWLGLIAALQPSAVRAGENLWPNPDFESDSGGLPAFWNRGGNRPQFLRWTTNRFVSPIHALEVEDPSRTEYGEWYSNPVRVSPHARYHLRFQRRYAVAGEMRLSANFSDATGRFLAGAHFVVSGTNATWRAVEGPLVPPPGAAQLRLGLASGGALTATGSLAIDDVALEAEPRLPVRPGAIRRVEEMPNLPAPFVWRDWRAVARGYDALVFDFGATGPHLPLIRWRNERVNFDVPCFWLPSYVGSTTHGGEGINSLAAVLGATLAGLDKRGSPGTNWVLMQAEFFNRANGLDLVLNSPNASTGHSFWYELLPHLLFYGLVDKYPDVASQPVPFRGGGGHLSMVEMMRRSAERWHEAARAMSGGGTRPDFNWTSYDFATGKPVYNGRWREPDAAAAIAWIEYMAYVRFGEARFLDAATWAMQYLDGRETNPLYEALLPYGATLAARMNAELGRNYDVARLVDWCFEGDGPERYGWGVVAGAWGGREVSGLASSFAEGGYAFAMNTFNLAGALAPLARYDPRYARPLGRWLLNVAVNARLFYADAHAADAQSSAFWTGDPGHVIPYEGLRSEWNGRAPFATGDPLRLGWGPQTDFALYGGSFVGMLGGLVSTTAVPGLIEVDLLATDYFHAPAHPTRLVYNPHRGPRPLPVEVGSSPRHVYDARRGVFVATHATGLVSVTIGPDDAAVLVVCPTNGPFVEQNGRLSLDGVAIDYWQGRLDTDADGLPDWYESFYAGHATAAQRDEPARNGRPWWECYALGVSPLEAGPAFVIREAAVGAGGRPEFAWTSVGGKRYAVEASARLGDAASPFEKVAVVAETNAAPGWATVTRFADQTAGAVEPGEAGSRFYRVRLASEPERAR